MTNAELILEGSRARLLPAVGSRRTGRRPATTASGYFLVECMVYIAVLAVVMAVAFSAFYRALDNSRDLARNSEQILHALAAGELWRQDVRAAIAPPRLVNQSGEQACEIDQREHQVVYFFSRGTVWRKVGDAPPRELLPRVRTSLIAADQRGQVLAYRWELELATRKRVVHIRPLFTFEAVPPAH